MSAALAEDLTPPIVKNAVHPVTVAAGTSRSVIELTNTFGLKGVTGEVVRFVTTLGNMDVELQPNLYPKTVANFLGYVTRGKYNGSFIHRTSSNFIIQGGGYYVAGNLDFLPIAANPPTVEGEHQGSNARGTIAMALLGGTNSANTGTDEWFFNLADNTGLDTFKYNQGPFTEFGHVIEDGLAVMDAIAAVPIYDASSIVVSSDASAFSDLPLLNYTSSQGTNIDPDLVFVKSISLIPTVPAAAGKTALLTLKATSGNPSLVKVRLTGDKLVLTYPSGAAGATKILLQAKDSAGTVVSTSFKVKVQ